MDIGNPPLRRSRERRMVATLLRLLYVIVSVASAAFPGIIVYLLLWLLIPARRPGDASPVRA